MQKGWKCPNCGKAHGPHVDTCPEAGGLAPLPFPVPLSWPETLYDPPRDCDPLYPQPLRTGDPVSHNPSWYYYTTC